MKWATDALIPALHSQYIYSERSVHIGIHSEIESVVDCDSKNDFFFLKKWKLLFGKNEYQT